MTSTSARRKKRKKRRQPEHVDAPAARTTSTTRTPSRKGKGPGRVYSPVPAPPEEDTAAAPAPVPIPVTSPMETSEVEGPASAPTPSPGDPVGRPEALGGHGHDDELLDTPRLRRGLSANLERMENILRDPAQLAEAQRGDPSLRHIRAMLEEGQGDGPTTCRRPLYPRTHRGGAGRRQATTAPTRRTPAGERRCFDQGDRVWFWRLSTAYSRPFFD